MIEVVILGFGNVGQHLYNAFMHSNQVKVIQVYNRTVSVFSSEMVSNYTTSLSNIKKADIYIIAIPDDAISDFSEKLSIRKQLVVHTSGSVGMNELSGNNRKGIFYALQTFSAATDVDFNEIPICIEAESEADVKTLVKLGEAISEKVVVINSQQRRKLHLAAVFVNNFVNHLYHISAEILDKNNLDFDLLKPLITETAKKVLVLSPSEAQTGPALRNDQKTIEKHLSLLTEMRAPDGINTNLAELYQLITKNIQNLSANPTKLS